MRAAVVTSFGAPDVLQVEERDIPSPGPDQVSIDEVSGIVRKVGSGVTDVAVGDPVCAFTIAGGYAEVAVAPALSAHRVPDRDDAPLPRA